MRLKALNKYSITHIMYSGGGQRCLAEIFREEKCLAFAFEGAESSRVPDVLGEIVPDVGAKVWESAKAIGFAVEALEFEHACVWRRAERAGRIVKVIQRKCQHSTCKVQERNGILYHRWNGTFSHLFADERILHIWKPGTILHLWVRFQWKEQIPQALLAGFALELKPPNYI